MTLKHRINRITQDNEQRKRTVTMRRTIAALAMVTLPTANFSYSQELVSGEWGGYIIVSDIEEKEFASFYVKELEAEDSRHYNITMVHYDRPYIFDELNVEEDRIVFKLDTGTLYDCDLSLQDDGSYTGDCVVPNAEQDSNKIVIRMIPREQEKTESGEGNHFSTGE